MFFKCVSFFPNINDTAKKYQFDLSNKNSLTIEVRHDGQFTPSVNVEKGRIRFHINFLKHLWAMAYSLFSFSHTIIELEIMQKWDGNALNLKNSFEIFFMKEWAYMLRNSNGYFPWTPNLPNPDDQNEEIKSINSLFQISISYIYFHELSHIILKHDPFTKDNSIKLEQEKDADNNALSIMIDDFENDQNKRPIGIGICIALSDLLFLNAQQIPKGIKTHPDADQRLFNVFEYLNIQNQITSKYLKRFTALVSEFYFRSYGLKLSQKTYSSTDELYQLVFDFFDTIKLP